jgi:hypothetical protein
MKELQMYIINPLLELSNKNPPEGNAFFKQCVSKD